jgi:hypothetical protein
MVNKLNMKRPGPAKPDDLVTNPTLRSRPPNFSSRYSRQLMGSFFVIDIFKVYFKDYTSIAPTLPRIPFLSNSAVESNSSSKYVTVSIGHLDNFLEPTFGTNTKKRKPIKNILKRKIGSIAGRHSFTVVSMDFN